jgi:hypothetical protein
MAKLDWAELQRRHDTPVLSADSLDGPTTRALEWLSSEAAAKSLARDPYWPKWETPWWTMCVLDEMGLAHRIPQPALKRLLSVVSVHYLQDFPLTTSELPKNRDPYRHILCHCALGTLGRIVHRNGLTLDAELPWFWPWVQRYQLPDGGWNCDEEACSKPVPISSVVSTLPVAELVLEAWPDKPGAGEMLQKSADYLLTRRLNRRKTPPHEVIDPQWWIPCFPRMYEYDALRGLEFVTDWARKMDAQLPADALTEAIERLDEWFSDAGMQARDITQGARTLGQDVSGQWRFGFPASRFELLDCVSEPAFALQHLQARWSRVLRDLPPYLR